MEKKIENKKEEKAEVEVVEKQEMNNLIQIHNYTNYCEIIESGIKFIVTKFLVIGKYLNKVKEEELYKLDGFSNIYEFSKIKFNFGETSTKNFINVFLKFTDKQEAELKKEYKNYSFSQLVELLPISEEKVSNYDPKMSVKEIKQTKRESHLTDDLNNCTKEFKNMTDKVKNLLIKELKLDELAKSNISYEIEGCNYKANIFININKISKHFVFQLSVNNNELSYSFYDRTYDMSSVYRCKNFLSFTTELRRNIKSYLKEIQEKAKEKERKKELKLEEKDKSSGAILKNDKERTEFVGNINNWTLVAEIKELHMLIYKFNVNNQYIKIYIGSRSVDTRKLILNEDCDYYYYISDRDIVNYLRDCRY